MIDSATIRGRWRIEKYASEADFRAGRLMAPPSEFDNILVTTGLAELGKLLTGTGSPTAFNAANAYIGVGTSNTAAAVGQTDMQANGVRAAMVASYPLTPTAGVYTWRADFGSGVANQAWAEFGLFNAAAAGVMLNRAVSAQGTKTSGQVWTATLTITLS
jgi:hypothetical protein